MSTFISTRVTVSIVGACTRGSLTSAAISSVNVSRSEWASPIASASFKMPTYIDRTLPFPEAFEIRPVLAGPHADDERHLELERVPHRVRGELGGGFHLVLGDLEQDLVDDLDDRHRP